MKNIELHIFTNSTEYIDTKKTIVETFKSFVATFGYIKPTIWLDPHPNINLEVVNNYVNYIKTNIDCTLNFTESLSDGYIRAVNNCKTEFSFMLEHDWIFKNNITHSLEDVCDILKVGELSHLRFNSISNNQNSQSASFDCIREIKINNTAVCLTPSASNNPHILNISEYTERCLPRIRNCHGSLGIEHNLVNASQGFAVYGGIDHDSTIIHTNGRNCQVWETYFTEKNNYPIESLLKYER
jgi:hypothetical protein